MIEKFDPPTVHVPVPDGLASLGGHFAPERSMRRFAKVDIVYVPMPSTTSNALRCVYRAEWVRTLGGERVADVEAALRTMVPARPSGSTSPVG